MTTLQPSQDARPPSLEPSAAPRPADPVEPGTSVTPAPDERPALRRAGEGAWVAGVAQGIATHLGWPPLLVRAGFVAMAMFNFLGVLVYGVLWVVLPGPRDAAEAPGLQAASRTGKRPRRQVTSRDFGVVSALVVGGVGVAWLTQLFGLGLPQQIFWPTAIAAAGLALIWRQADDTTVADDHRTSKWLRPLVSGGGWAVWTRIALGVGMLGTAFTIVVGNQIGFANLPTILLLNLLVVAGVGLVSAPWIYRARRRMNEATEQRLLADARADMAAHLHDSVLQTLALIQRQSTDAQAVASLARRQERELRGWLYGSADGADETHLKAALVRAAQEVEDERGVPVEVVCVGDIDLTSDLSAMVQAAREAIMNAAKHSGAAKIDVYAEVEPEQVEVFVRDRGKGFAIDEVADDRQGVRNSIIARMERHGGRATIRSAPREGTDIRLEMKP
ncbi:ATP-binding protein [Aestuariimicrobium sp. T2.26MG-19.2B]|uniref:ATP-binding protein n=1 Tax=Aestuariimicrobium sp. T2.26MG-19.2B TaxID=3040679 RepID=UPI0024775FF5|nr:ATP-binding protein [Aestuariimicrobium sp. T2.26MG-19.2B]CAI9407081.1 hypothetical protein AESSP_01753 [Aestuariimicrobium sp. T2.26MG-19.2B]